MRRLKKNQNRGIKKIEIKLKGKRGIEKNGNKFFEQFYEDE